MNLIRLVINLLRLPLDLIMWAIDFCRVTRFVFSANQKISERCPFGCYRDGNVVQAGLRKCPGAGRYGNFWLFRTLCRCARKPKEAIPGVPAFCRERGNFEITFSRWATILMMSLAVGGTVVYAVGSGFLAQRVVAAVEVASPSTLKALRDVAASGSRPASSKARPRASQPKPEVRVNAGAVATTEEPLKNAVKQALTAPSDPVVRLRLARGYYALGMRAEARKILRFSRETTPDVAAMVAFLAWYDLAEGKTENATALLAEVYKGEELPAAVVPVALVAAHAAGDEALAQASSARLDGRQDEEARLARALVQEETLPTAAVIELARAFPDLTPLLLRLVFAEGDKPSAERLLKIAGTDGLSGHLRAALALRLWQLDERDAAFAVAETIVRSHPDAVPAQIVRVEGYLAAGLTQHAAEVARAALPLAETEAERSILHRRLAQALQRAGDSKAALAAWRAVLAAEPDEEAEAAVKRLLESVDVEP